MFAYPPAPPAINSFGGEVSNVEEVRRARVDPCGSLTFFISKKENRVYVKYIDLSGLPVIDLKKNKKGDYLDILNSIVAILTVASCLSAAFNYVVIRPLQHAIDLNSDVLHELKREIERSVADRRALDVRVAALEEAHKINSKRLDEICSTLSENSKK